jgi:hypothetical protein
MRFLAPEASLFTAQQPRLFPARRLHYAVAPDDQRCSSALLDQCHATFLAEDADRGSEGIGIHAVAGAGRYGQPASQSQTRRRIHDVG